MLIRERALCYSVAWADAEEIDSINILQATMLAMRRALLGLAVPPQQVFVDGNRCPCADGLGFECLFEAVIKGDANVPSISAASILAKTTRDALMRDLDHRYPGFSLSGHKGYPTRVARRRAECARARARCTGAASPRCASARSGRAFDDRSWRSAPHESLVRRRRSQRGVLRKRSSAQSSASPLNPFAKPINARVRV